jgi:uncharacterized protein YuzB (UPF0349 family)
LLSLFAPVESCFSSVGSGQDQVVNTVGQFHLMEIDEQPKRDILQFHVLRSCALWMGRIFSLAFALPPNTLPPAYRIAAVPLA